LRIGDIVNIKHSRGYWRGHITNIIPMLSSNAIMIDMDEGPWPAFGKSDYMFSFDPDNGEYYEK